MRSLSATLRTVPGRYSGSPLTPGAGSPTSKSVRRSRSRSSNLDKYQLRGISLEGIRRDRILQEALASGAGPLHLTLVFNIDHTNAMASANAAPT